MIGGLLRNLRDGAVSFLRGERTLSISLANVLISIGIMRNIGMYPRIVKTRDGFRIYVNDPATLLINIPDHYEKREYMRHPDYIPRSGWAVIDVGAYVGIYSLWASSRRQGPCGSTGT